MYDDDFLNKTKQFLQDVQTGKISANEKLNSFKGLMRDEGLFDIDYETWESFDEDELQAVYDQAMPIFEDYFAGKTPSRAARLQLTYLHNQQGCNIVITRTNTSVQIECSVKEISDTYKQLVANMPENLGNEDYMRYLHGAAPKQIEGNFELTDTYVEVDLGL